MSRPKTKNNQGKQAVLASKVKVGNTKKNWLAILAILLITFLIFYPATNYDFVNWDDDVNITNNNNVKELSVESVKKMFTGTVIGGYTPLTTLTFAVEHHFFGLKPRVFHLNNILLHMLCTALVFLLLKKLGMNLFITVIATLLFGIHPMRVESVAWVTERKDVLYTLFYLLSALSYATWYKSKKIIFYVLSLFIFMLSLLSKIQAVSLPLTLLLIDFWFEKRFYVTQILNKIPFFVLSLATGLAGIYLLKEAGSLETGSVLPFYQRIFIGTYSLGIYFIKAVFPYQMSAIYPFPAKLELIHYLSMPVILIVGFLVWKIRKHRNEVIFGTLFFLFNVVFMLQVIGAGQGFIADRFTYVPYIGLFFLLACFANSLMSTPWKTAVLFVGTIYLFTLVVTTHNRVKVWQNSETLFTDVISKYQKVPVAHNNMGKYFREQKQYDKAIAAYTKALAIDPKASVTFSNRGKAYFDTGRTNEALADFNKSIEINGEYAEARSNRGAALAEKGNFDAALLDLNKAVELDPGNSVAYSNRSLTHYSLNNFEKAAEDVTSFLQLKPNDADMINLRGLCNNKLNKNNEALADFNRAIELLPNQGIFWQNRSFFFNKTGNKTNALRDIKKAQELGVHVHPDYLKLLETQ